MLGNLLRKSFPGDKAPFDSSQGKPFDSSQSKQGGQVTGNMSQSGQPASLEPSANAQGSTMAPSIKHDLSVLTHLDSRSTAVLQHAETETKRVKQAFMEPEQLLLGLLYDQDIFSLLEKFSLNVSKVSSEINAKLKEGTFSGNPTLSSASLQVLEAAFTIAKNHEAQFISPEDMLIALFSADSAQGSTQILKQEGLTEEKLTETMEKSGVSSSKKSIISKFGIDLTESARSGKLDPISGRDKEIDRLIHIMLRRTKNNPIIIGEAGVGKTALIEGLAELIVSGKVPQELAGKKIIQLDLASLVAGASHRGEFEERLRSVVKETMASDGQIILFVDEIHTLIGAGDTQGALDASNIIKPFLARGQLQLIGTTTTAEFRKYFEKDKAFERRFQPIICEEPTEEAAFEMLKMLRPKYEKFHGVIMSDEVLKSAVHLSKKYIGERFLPDKAVDLLDEAAADVKLKHSSGKSQNNEVHTTDIEQVVSNWTGIPITKLTEDEGQKLLHLEDLIHHRLIDQEQAVKGVAEAVRRGRIGLSSASRPIASFIFLGPTGVGKTELAKTLAEILFGRDDAMIRLDMSEYMEKHEVAKLIGAPPGYVGYEEGGQLTEAVKRKPYSIVLLDEVEKAHPDVFNILLQLLEDGRLTDNKGNTISFKNTIIIATSNLGSILIQQMLSKPHTPGQNMQAEFASLQKLLMQELLKFFKPELVNRFDDVIMFKPLSQDNMAFIAKLGIDKTKKLLKEQGYDMQISEKALARLAQEGYDPVYGARPLRRLVQSAIENPIALEIISKHFIPGETIGIDYDDAKQQFMFIKVTTEAVVQPTNTGQLPQTVDNQQMPPVDQSSIGMQAPIPPAANGLSQPLEPQLPVGNAVIGSNIPPAPWPPTTASGAMPQPE